MNLEIVLVDFIITLYAIFVKFKSGTYNSTLFLCALILYVILKLLYYVNNKGINKKILKANGFKFEKEILKDESNAKKASATLLGFFLMFMFICSSATSRFILKDKIDKTYHRICMTKVDRKKYILGNILSNFFILMIQSTLGFLIIQKGLKFNTQAYFIDILIVLWSFALCSVSLSMVIITFAKSTNSVTVLNSLIVTPTCMLGGCFWPRELMGDTLKKISNFIPQTWAVDALNKVIEGESIKTFYINILILIGFSAIFFLLALYKSNLENSTKNFI